MPWRIGIMISAIRIANFKSYEAAKLPLAPLTLLIGANASGKSNAIEAIRFLSWLAEGRRLDDIITSVQEEDVSIRGTLFDLPRDPDQPITLGCDLDREEWNQLFVSINVGEEGSAIVDETIIGGMDTTFPLYKIFEPARGFGHDVQVEYNNFNRGRSKPRIVGSDQQAIFTQLESPARYAARHERSQDVIPLVVREFRAALEQILFLDPSPRRMRQYSFVVDRGLKGDGSNISSVLYDLCQDEEQKQAVLGFITDLPEQRFLDIAFIETPRREVMLRLTESFASEERIWDAPVLSDGTLRVLAVAAALLSAPRGSLVIIEEIDNGVHPSRAGSLLKHIEETAERRGLRVLLTTHNPALLDTLPTRAIPDVVACYRDPDQGDSRLLRLAELRSYPELVARGPLGQLMTRGVLDYFLKHQRTPEEKKAQALDWLESLQAQVGDA